MARLPYRTQTDVPPEFRTLLATNNNITRVLMHSPHLTRRFQDLVEYIRNDSRLDPRLRELAILQVAYVTRSGYEYAHHLKIALAVGVSDDDVRAIIEETAGRHGMIDPLAKAVLRAAREMSLDLTVSNDTFMHLKQALDDDCLVDLFVTIAFYNAVARVLAAMLVDIEDGYRPYLDKFPLPAA